MTMTQTLLCSPQETILRVYRSVLHAVIISIRTVMMAGRAEVTKTVPVC